MRLLEPADGVLAFYDGRVDGYRFADGPNWVDDGALSLGIASYAVVCDDQAMVYDTHVSVEHARYVRTFAGGPRRPEVHGGSQPLASGSRGRDGGVRRVRDHRVETDGRAAGPIQRGDRGRDTRRPARDQPAVAANDDVRRRRQLTIGTITLELIHTDIHSDDATVVWWPDRRLLLCGDTMEDTVTYVDEPERFPSHLTNLEQLRDLAPEHILPNHGDPEVIAAGGYGPDLIGATEQYILAVLPAGLDAGLRDASLRELIGESLRAGAVTYFAPYEAVHRANVETVLADA